MRAYSALAAMTVLSAVFLGGSACRGPTSITVEVFTDAVCGDLHGVSIASSYQQSTESIPPATTTTKCANLGERRSRVGTLTILPSGADDAEIAIRVVGGIDRPIDQCDAARGYEGCIVARRWIRFQPGVELTLPIELHLDCKGVACDATSTCVKAGCRSASVGDPGGCSGEECLGQSPVDAAVTVSKEAAVDSGTDSGTDDTQVADTAGDDALVDSTLVDSAVDGTVVADSSFGDTTVDSTFGDADDASSADSAMEAEAPLSCPSTEKICSDKCVSSSDPAYGCGSTTCSPCDPTTHATYACAGGACTTTGCEAGYKDCSGACVKADPEHGCSATACTACPTANGVASCSAGACVLTCNGGYKLCGGKCVNVGDPTYGCGATTCDATSCPSAGGGTLVCSGTTCLVGACGAGTKVCAGTCVPTDTTHGCADVTRCTACGAGESCVGGPPTVCQCVPESFATTCSKVECGVTKNNCNQTVNCGTAACSSPSFCGGGGAANKCGCTPIGTPCDGVNCGVFNDTCGKPVDCTCASPKTCGGAGLAGKCGCTPRTCDFKKCGDTDDGCGNKITCGCSAGNTCGGGGEPGICGCKARSLEDMKKECETRSGAGEKCPVVDDGCGKPFDCACPGEKCCPEGCVCATCTCK